MAGRKAAPAGERDGSLARGGEIRPHPPEGAVRRLLADAGLPNEDVTPTRLEHFFGCWSEGELAGVVGLEIYGEVALLRSLVVRRDREGLGIGPGLVAYAECQAAERGARTLYLLTTTAQEYFALLGYAQVPREQAPNAIRATREFSVMCPASSALMVKRIGAAAGAR